MTAAITDFNQFTGLRMAANQNDPAALREVASQFEALFLQTMLKNMREASLGDPIFGNSDQHEMYQGMMDQQLALEMASGSRNTVASASTPAVWSDPATFAPDIWPHAERAGRRLNVAPEAIVAQAALETGWGAHVMPNKRGDNSFNLFGIKAGAGWQGEQVSRQTLEFENGVPRPQQAKFRAYTDVAATFDDYTEFLIDNPRYSGVSGHGADVAGFANALQSSGYATDPRYADKLTNVLNSPTMRSVISDLKNLRTQPITAQLSPRAQ
jgi:flagellar protein FlgJ